MPPSATAQLIFAQTDSAEIPGTDAAFSYLDGLPTVTDLISGGNPSTCYHGVPAKQPRMTNTPIILPAVPVTHTSVSVLTTVGRPVTLAGDPFGGGGSNPSPTDDHAGPPPQSQIEGPSPPAPPPPPPTDSPNAVTKVVVGDFTVVQQTTAVVVNGQTFTQGQATTLTDNVIISVGSKTTEVVVSGLTVSLPAPSNTKPSNASPGAAIASGIGISMNSGTGKLTYWTMALEGAIVVAFPGILALL